MRINIVAVGKLKEKYWTDAIKEYQKRLSRFCRLEIIEIAEGRSKEEEKNNILKKIKGYLVILDRKGKNLASEDFAKIFSDNLIRGKSEFSFVIGGSEGLSDEVLKRGDLIVSFGGITYPHQLMRVILIEQIYRGMTINNNITYHK